MRDETLDLVLDVLFSSAFWILVLLWALWELDFAPWSSQITRYTQIERCSDGDCVWENASAVTYTTHESRQDVTYVVGEYVFRDDNCIVHDRKNWTCEDDYELSFGFIDGDWFSTGPPQIQIRQRNIWKTKWWWHEIWRRLDEFFAKA